MKEYVLDANALVRLFRNTPGADVVERLVGQAKSGRAHLTISVVNLIEVLHVLAHYLGQEKAFMCLDDARHAVEPMPVDEQVALNTAVLRIRYKLGLADCFCGGVGDAHRSDTGNIRPRLRAARQATESACPAAPCGMTPWLCGSLQGQPAGPSGSGFRAAGPTPLNAPYVRGR